MSGGGKRSCGGSGGDSLASSPLTPPRRGPTSAGLGRRRPNRAPSRSSSGLRSACAVSWANGAGVRTAGPSSPPSTTDSRRDSTPRPSGGPGPSSRRAVVPTMRADLTGAIAAFVVSCGLQPSAAAPPGLQPARAETRYHVRYVVPPNALNQLNGIALDPDGGLFICA